MDEEFYTQYREAEIKSKKSLKNKTSGKKIDEENMSKKFYTNLRKAAMGFEPNLKVKWIINKLKEGEKIVIFSSLKNFGINKIKSQLPKNVKYSQVTGDILGSKRQHEVNKFNKGKTNILFITKAGGEGLDLKGVRNLVIVERGWNDTIDRQVIGRTVRYGSHSHLPKKERYVDIFYLDLKKPKLSVREQAIFKYNKKNGGGLYLEDRGLTKSKYPELLTADEIMKEISEGKKKRMDVFLEWLRSISLGTKHCENKK